MSLVPPRRAPALLGLAEIALQQGKLDEATKRSEQFVS